MTGIIDFVAKTGIIAGCSMLNLGANVAAAKLVDSKVKPKVPTRVEGQSDQDYVLACEKAQKKCDRKKALAKTGIGVLTTVGTSVVASFALGAVSDIDTSEAPAEPAE